jgi:cation transport ATPase
MVAASPCAHVISTPATVLSAIVRAARERNLTLLEATEFTSATGLGVRSKVNEEEVHIGNGRYFHAYPQISLDIVIPQAEQLEESGKTTVIVATVNEKGAGQVLGLIAIADTLRPNVPNTEVALETADIVLMSDNLAHIPYGIALSRQTRRTLIQNLVFARGMIVILIGSVLGFKLALPLSVIGPEGSTVLVSLNGLRLLGYRKK